MQISFKQTLAKILAWINAKDSQALDTVSMQLANSNVMTALTDATCAWRLYGDTYIVGFSLGVKTTQARTNLTVLRLHMDGYIMRPYVPYFFPCSVGGTFVNCYTNNDAYWFTVPTTWSANTEFRISGMGFMKKTTFHI